MDKIKAWLLAVLAGGAGAVTLGVAAAEWDKSNMTCDEFKLAAVEIKDEPELAYLLQNQILERCPETATLVECWGKPNGDLCRYGLHYGPGLGGARDGVCDTFTPGVDKAYPCVTGGMSAEAAINPAVREAGDVIRNMRDKVDEVAVRKLEAEIVKANEDLAAMDGLR
jgi:hypothetical protein